MKVIRRNFNEVFCHSYIMLANLPLVLLSHLSCFVATFCTCVSDFSPGKWNNWFSFRHVTYQHFITLSTFCVVALTLHFFSDIKKSMGSRFDVSLLCTLTAMLNLKHFMICAICCDWCHAFIQRPSSKRSIVVWLWVHHEVPPPAVPPPRYRTHPHIPL